MKPEYFECEMRARSESNFISSPIESRKANKLIIPNLPSAFYVAEFIFTTFTVDSCCLLITIYFMLL